MDKYWVEVRPTVRRSGRPNLVPLSDVDKYSGFRSAFAFDETTKAAIEERGSTSYLRGTSVYADTLFVDFDRSDGSTLIETLKAYGIRFTRWHSGGRSIHLHVSLEPVFGPWVPLSCKKWIRSNAHDADISFYHPAGMFRLPRTYHEKRPGHCKQLLETVEGKLLSLQEFRPPEFRLGRQLESSFETLTEMLTRPASEGARRPFLWQLGTTAAELGMEFGSALETLQFWNDNFSIPPHEPDVIEKQCRSAYERVSRK